MRFQAVILCSLLAVLLAAGCGGDSSDTSTAELAVPPPETAGEFQAFDTPPALVHFEEPHYPGAARREGIEGTVLVRVIVAADGNVVDATILESSHDALSESALSAARQCRFSPGQLDGEPVRCAVAIPFKYSLM